MFGALSRFRKRIVNNAEINSDATEEISSRSKIGLLTIRFTRSKAFGWYAPRFHPEPGTTAPQHPFRFTRADIFGPAASVFTHFFQGIFHYGKSKSAG